MSKDTAVHTRLLQVIPEPRVRSRISLIVELSSAAVQDLSCLDRSIYEEYGAQAMETLDTEGSDSRKGLEELAQVVLDATRRLDSYIRNCDFAADHGEGDSDGDGFVDFDFDLGGGEEEQRDEMSLSDDDIAGALGALSQQESRSSKERWDDLSSEIQTLGYGLGAQLRDFDGRFVNSLDSKRSAQALRILDDVRNSLTDGVFALMSAICDTYLEDYDRDQVLPGHRDTLGKALLVRRGLAELRRAINAQNAHVQNRKLDIEARDSGVSEIAGLLFSYFESDAFAAMRPADQTELERFYSEVDDKGSREAAQTCEGLDKYLDSLSVVNERDVLLKHDRELKNEVAEVLEGVEPLLHISPHGAMQLVSEAFEKSEALIGFSDAFDEIYAAWLAGGQDADSEQKTELAKRLAALMGPAN